MSGIGLLGGVILGLLAGWGASVAINKHYSLLVNLAAGVVGAFLAVALATSLHVEFATSLIGALCVSAVGAAIVLGVLAMSRAKA